MASEIGEHRPPLFDAAFGVRPTDHGVRSRLMHARIEPELPAPFRILARRNDRPAGDDLGEIRHVRLRVDRAHTKRMQFEDFPREVFVEAFVLIAPGDRVRTDRACIVEIDEHRRVALDRDEHFGKAAEHVRTDRLALVRAAQRPHRPLVGRDAEMVGPEPHQPLDKAEVGAKRGVDARLRLFHIELLRHPRLGIGLGLDRRAARRHRIGHRRLFGGRGRRVLRRLPLRSLGKPLRLALLPEVECRARGFATHEQVGIGDTARPRPIEFGHERPARIGRDRDNRAGPGTESEAMQRKRRLGLGIARHETSVFETFANPGIATLRSPESGGRLADGGGRTAARASTYWRQK